MEHIPAIVAGAAGSVAAAGATGAATEFGKKLASLGGEWLADRFGRSAQTALQTASTNGADFQRELELRVTRLEQLRELSPGQADAAFERPDTLSALRTGFNAASETSDPVKRGVLAALVADRLKAQSDSVEAVTSRRAIELIPNIGSRQLRTLAHLIVVSGIRPTDANVPVWPYVETGLTAIGDIIHNRADVLYLESLGLLKYNEFLGSDLADVLQWPRGTPANLDVIRATRVGSALLDVWAVWTHVSFTLVGQYLGVYAHDEIVGTQTTFPGLS